MFHIILLIFKIIGLLLLAVIGLLILILLTVLLVPIRYKIKAGHGEENWADCRASWLLHLFRARFYYLGETPRIRVKVLWITLYDNLVPKQPKEKNKKKNTARKAARQARDNKKDEKAGITDKLNKPDRADKTDKPGKVISGDKTSAIPVKQNISDDRSEKHAEHIETDLKNDNHQEKAGEGKTGSIFSNIFAKIKGFRDRIQAFFGGMKEKLVNFFIKLVKIRNKIKLVSDFIKDEINREGFKITYSSLKKLLKHVLPRKLKSRIVFGTGDPCSTGQALGAMGILYSFYGDKVKIIPDFENKVFEGEHYARGRIRLVTVLIIVIKLIYDKRFKRLRRNFLILKEAL